MKKRTVLKTGLASPQPALAPGKPRLLSRIGIWVCVAVVIWGTLIVAFTNPIDGARRAVWAGGLLAVAGGSALFAHNRMQARIRHLAQVNAALRESEAQYRNVVERANEGIAIIQDGVVRFANQCLAGIWGGTVDEVVGTPISDYIHPDEQTQVLGRYGRRLTGVGGRPFYDTLLTRKDGSTVYAEINAGLIPYEGRDADLVIVRDVTARREAEAQIAAAQTDLKRSLDEAAAMRQVLLSVIEDQKRSEAALAAERSLLRTLVDHLPDAIYVKDVACRKTLANPADLCNMGIDSEAEVLGKTDFDLFPRDLAETFYANDHHVISSGRAILNREEPITRPDGSRGWQLTSKVPVRDAAGQVVGLIGIGHDITDRKRAEEALRESEARYRQVIRVARGVAYEYDWTTETYSFMEPSIEVLTGYSAEALTPDLFKTLIVRSRTYTSEDDPGFDAPGVVNEVGSAPYHRADLLLRRKDGSTIWVMDCAIRIRDAEGDVKRTIGILQDISDRMEAQAQLRHHIEHLATTADIQQSLASTLDQQTIWARLGQGILQLFPDVATLFLSSYSHSDATIAAEYGFQDGEPVDVRTLPTMPLPALGQGAQSQVIHTHQPLVVGGNLEEGFSQEDGLVHAGLADHDTKSAVYVPMLIQDGVVGVIQMRSDSPNRFHDADVQLLSMLASTAAVGLQNARLYDLAQSELAERIRTEMALRESERKLRTLFEIVPVGVSILNAERQLVYSNPALAQIMDMPDSDMAEEGLGMRQYLRADGTPMPASGSADARAVQEHQIVRNVETGIVKEDGSVLWTSVSAVPTQLADWDVVIVTVDITARKQAEQALQAYADQLEAMVAARTRALEEAQERLLGQERLAVLGQVAGGIAHELRTPLGAIKNGVYLLNMMLDTPDATIQEALALIDREIKTSDQIITSLLAFTRPRQPSRKVVQVNGTIEHVLAHIEVPLQVQVQREVDAGLPEILADPGHLTRVLDNLMTNAIQAMPQGGDLTVRATRLSSLPEQVAVGFLPQDACDEAGWVVVSVTDSGVGISEEHRAHLFQPLFSTKAKGIGLGLALVKLLIEANGGGIAVESTLGQGTTFHTYWPALTGGE